MLIMMEFQLINVGFSADFIDGFWNDIVMVFGLTNTDAKVWYGFPACHKYTI